MSKTVEEQVKLKDLHYVNPVPHPLGASTPRRAQLYPLDPRLSTFQRQVPVVISGSLEGFVEL